MQLLAKTFPCRVRPRRRRLCHLIAPAVVRGHSCHACVWDPLVTQLRISIAHSGHRSIPGEPSATLFPSPMPSPVSSARAPFGTTRAPPVSDTQAGPTSQPLRGPGPTSHPLSPYVIFFYFNSREYSISLGGIFPFRDSPFLAISSIRKCHFCL